MLIRDNSPVTVTLYRLKNMQGYWKGLLRRTLPEVKCLQLISSRSEMCMLSVSNMNYHKFSHDTASCMLNGKMLKWCKNWRCGMEFHAEVLRAPDKRQLWGWLKDIFLFLNENIYCDPSLEPFQWDGFSDGSQNVFLWRNFDNYP